jgi:hypothetical protein
VNLKSLNDLHRETELKIHKARLELCEKLQSWNRALPGVTPLGKNAAASLVNGKLTARIYIAEAQMSRVTEIIMKTPVDQIWPVIKKEPLHPAFLNFIRECIGEEPDA